MFKKILIYLPFISFAHSAQGGWQNSNSEAGECLTTQIFGVFPTMGLSCETLATLLGTTSIVCAFVFWTQVTK